MKNVSVDYDKGYKLNYLFTPGLWMTEAEKKTLLDKMNIINEKTGMKLRYGLFDPSKDPLNLLNSIVVCLMEADGEVDGFFYSYIVDMNQPLVHQGLIMVLKNKGADLLEKPYIILNHLLFQYFGEKKYFATNITAMPKSIGAFCHLFSNVWPSPYADLSRCPYGEYKVILSLLLNKYIIPFFPFPEHILLDDRRFVLKTKSRDMGFETDFYKLARDPKFEINIFAFFWLKHHEEEDMIQVGSYDIENNDNQYEIIKQYVSKKLETKEV